ncbi:MAG: NAD-dependent epimerase/dehydratase family protein, partial [Candidatus Elarobacter sp.]
MPLAFVTGASGFVGANLVRVLLQRGWRVRALVRGAAPSLDGLAVDLVRGDLFAPTLAEAMRGCDALFHLAATYSLWKRDRDRMLHANVAGTRTVLAAALEAGIPRTVHTSSVAAIGVRADG